MKPEESDDSQRGSDPRAADSGDDLIGGARSGVAGGG